MLAVSGATGFVGQHLVTDLAAAGMAHRAVQRPPAPAPDHQWAIGQLRGTSAVVHLAGRAHRLGEAPGGAALAYRQANLDLTRQLAEAASAAGVTRFVHVSSIKVLGDGPSLGLTPEAPLAPTDPYGESKAAAEQWLQDNAANLGLALTIVRPPLVHGPGVRGNFLRLLHLARRGYPLPLASLEAPRSMVYVGNLVALLAHLACAEPPVAARNTILHVADAAPTVPALLRALGQRLGVRQPLWPMPPTLLGAAARLLGQQSAWQRLATPLVVDDSSSRAATGWQPPFSADHGYDATTAWFRTAHP